MTSENEFNSINTQEFIVINQESVETTAKSTATNNLISKLIKVIKNLAPILWIIILLLVFLPLLGNFISQNSFKNQIANPILADQTVVIERKQYKIDNTITLSIKQARQIAETQASKDLDQWISQLMNRVDNSFIPWYFDYFNQKGKELNVVWTGLYSSILHWTNTSKPTGKQAIAEKLTQDFQREFAIRVLRPQIAQLELERIARNTIDLYAEELVKNLGEVQASYQIPRGDWERYINDIAITAFGIEGNPTGKLQSKILVGTTGFILAKAMLPTIGKLSSKLVIGLASKTGAKMAAKTGTLVAGKLGVQLIDPIAAVGIMAWDIWDHHHTVNIEKPILRQALSDYLEQVKLSLLDNHQNSIMSSIYQIEDKILESVTNTEINISS